MNKKMDTKVVDEIKNILVGKSGDMTIKIVNDTFSISSMATSKGKFKMIMFAIAMLAEEEGKTYLEQVKEFEEFGKVENHI